MFTNIIFLWQCFQQNYIKLIYDNVLNFKKYKNKIVFKIFNFTNGIVIIKTYFVKTILFRLKIAYDLVVHEPTISYEYSYYCIVGRGSPRKR